MVRYSWRHILSGGHSSSDFLKSKQQDLTSSIKQFIVYNFRLDPLYEINLKETDDSRGKLRNL
jgi:hypothetical protein